jgi:hypothetical protein
VVWLIVNPEEPGQLSGLLLNTPPGNDVLNATEPTNPVLLEQVTV